jgi:hypothetical protein
LTPEQCPVEQQQSRDRHAGPLQPGHSRLDGRILSALDALVHVTRDERFVTARHCPRSLWKVGLAGPRAPGAAHRAGRPLPRLRHREERHPDRNDIILGLKKLHDAVADPEAEATAREFIALEPDERYRPTYAGRWKPTRS